MYLNNSKQIVIKIGSSLLIDDKKNIRKKWLLDFVVQIIFYVLWSGLIALRLRGMITASLQ